MKHKGIYNWTVLSMYVAAITTTAYLLMLGYFNTLTLDDYGFVVDLAHYSPWQWTKQMYMTWQGRFSDVYVSGIIFNLWGRAASLLTWTIVHLILGYSVIALLIKDVLKLNDKLLLIGSSTLIANVCILSVFEISTFYWLCCAAYFLTVYATILLIDMLFFSSWNIWLRWCVSILCAVYISGSAENYTPLVLMVLGIIWLLTVIKDSKSIGFIKAFQKSNLLFVVCAVLGIGFLLMLLAPGNAIRMQNGEEMVGFIHNFQFDLFIKRSIVANMIFFLRLLSRGLYYLLILPIFIFMGACCKRENKLNKIGRKIGIATILLIGLLIIAVTSCVYGIGYYPPLRSMSFVAYVMMAYTGYVGILLGYLLEEKKMKLINIVTISVAILWTIFGAYYIWKEYPVVKEYHAYVKQRDASIMELVNADNTEPYYAEIYCAPLWKNSYSILRTCINKGIGISSEFEELYFPYMISVLEQNNPNDFKNKGLGEYYNANFKILTK